MKKYLRLFGVFAVLAVSLCIRVLADDGSSGIYNVTAEQGVTYTAKRYDEALGEKVPVPAQDAVVPQGTGTVPADDFYPDAQLLTITFDGLNSGSNYAVFALKDAAPDENGYMPAPTEDSLVYLYQKSSIPGTQAEFDVFPLTLEPDATYYVYLTGTGETATKKLEFSYTELAELLRLLRGDADGDGTVATEDALLILQYIVRLVSEGALDLQAADVNGDGIVSTEDAIQILRYIVRLTDTL